MSKAKKCPECKNEIVGRGKRHATTCSHYKPPKAAPVKRAGSLEDQIDERLPVATLLRLQGRIETLLAGKDKSEVKEVREAMARVTDLEKQLEEARKKLL